MKNYGKHNFRQSGFTLVELLIVLALSGLLSAALARIVIGNKQNVLLADSYAKVQESSRYAMNYLARDFRMAGYLGCVNADMASTKITNVLSPADTVDYKPAQHSFQNPIRALDNYNPTNTQHVSAFTSVSNSPIKPVAGTDVFKTSSALSTDLLSSNVQASNTNNFTVLGPANQISVIKPGTIMMLTDCNTAHIFSASYVSMPTPNTAMIMHDINVNPGVNNTTATFGINYLPGSQVLLMNTTVYYIGPSIAFPAAAGQPQINSLYRSSTINGGQSEELVPYVQDMQLMYSVDNNNDGSPDVYKTAAQIDTDGDDMIADVYSVNITLTVMGDIDVDAPASGGVANGGRLRKTYSRLVNIRNAGLAAY